ncbi:unnamed protein product [Caenorhabditis auriculariae]|uniref:Dynein light intermediate chain n=1 Tax=Caenorhabditis auriculariae TaxID=2777116 RepID=A0A8S1GPC2_9PELO|nr:unnamed protein product [Caenorhabditis auriculariae]
MVAASSDVLNSTFALPAAIATVSGTTQSEEGIWRLILSEFCSKGTNTQQGSAVLILGDNLSGKSSLLRRLERSDVEKHGSALEYHVLSVQNDARDASYAYQLGTAGQGALGPAEALSLPVWVLDGDEKFSSLLQFALPVNPLKTVCLLVASLDNPGLIHSLRRWANLCSQEVQKKFNKETIHDAKKHQERQWQEYVDPVESSMSTSMVGGFVEEPNLLPLEQGVLAESCGVYFVVVITKSDLVSELSEAQYAKVLVQVRRLCLQLGAALVFTSSKDSKKMFRS